MNVIITLAVVLAVTAAALFIHAVVTKKRERPQAPAPGPSDFWENAPLEEGSPPPAAAEPAAETGTRPTGTLPDILIWAGSGQVLRRISDGTWADGLRRHTDREVRQHIARGDIRPLTDAEIHSLGQVDETLEAVNRNISRMMRDMSTSFERVGPALRVPAPWSSSSTTIRINTDEPATRAPAPASPPAQAPKKAPAQKAEGPSAIDRVLSEDDLV